jgi:CBS-domain-containing membrane protein
MTWDVRCARPGDDLNRAAEIMWNTDCGAVPVVDAEERVVGMITDRDVCMAAFTKGLPLGAIRVEDVMTKEVRTCSLLHDVATALDLMQRHQLRRLPIVDEQRKLRGIVSLNDLAREADHHKGRSSRGVGPWEIAATLASVSKPRARPVPDRGESESVLVPLRSSRTLRTVAHEASQF